MILKNPYIASFGKNCIGCQKHNTDIMISATSIDYSIDIFISEKDAKELIEDLQTTIKRNNKKGE